MKRTMGLWALALLCSPMVFAGSGKYAGEFLAIGVGGRALGMGGAAVALTSDATAGFWNPANLARIDYPQIVLMHNEQFGSLLNHDYGAVAIPFGPFTSLGLSVIRLGIDDIADTRAAGVDANGNLTYDLTQFSRVDPSRVTYFNAADWAFLFTYARRVTPGFSYGANLKYIRRELGDNSANGIGVDVGVWYRPTEDLFLGATVQDVTTTLIAWDTGTNELISPTVKVGGAYQIAALGGRFVPALDVDVRFENRGSVSMIHVGPVSADLHSGVEYQFKDLLFLRGGYSDVKQLTLGAGLRFPKLAIDYSFAKFGSQNDIGNSHRISILFTLETDQFKRASPPDRSE